MDRVDTDDIPAAVTHRLFALTFLPPTYITHLVDELKEYENLELYIHRARHERQISRHAADKACLALMLNLGLDWCSELLEIIPNLQRAIAFTHEDGEVSQYQAMAARLAVVLGATSFSVRKCLEGVEQPCSPMTALQYLEKIGCVNREEVPALYMSFMAYLDVETSKGYLNADDAQGDMLEAFALAQRDRHLDATDRCTAHLVVQFGMTDTEAQEIGMRPDIMWNIVKAVRAAKILFIKRAASVNELHARRYQELEGGDVDEAYQRLMK
ncbi:MAG: hypothetical protein LQ348_002802 [Seirophora lacunosa]|nr:MAG: hypothetical protein LQ348_002802 [Seirophora lacunosa]